MHRVLLIRVGKDLEPCFDYLNACALERNGEPALAVRFVHASAEALGNLSQPLEILKERLFGDLTDALTALLRQVPGRRGGFLLDILIVTQHGEPMTTKASQVVVSAVHEIIVERFSAVFPGGAQSVGVGWRMQEIGILPGHADSKRPRNEMLSSLREHVEWVKERRENEWPIHRMTLLDATTPGGISPLEDLLDQTESLIHLLVFSGIRRSPLGIQLFETVSSDMVATCSIARLETPAGWIQESMVAKMLAAIANHLLRQRSVTVATPDELVGDDIFENPEKRFEFSATLRAHLVEALTMHGTAAIIPLLHLLELLPDHIRRLAEIATAAQRTDVTPPAQQYGRIPTVSGLTVALGGGTFGVAYLALGLATIMSAGIALATAFVGAAALLMVLPKAQTSETRQTSSRKEGEPLPAEMAGILIGHVAQLESDLRRTQSAFEGVAAGIDLTTPVALPQRAFVSALASEELASTIFESLGTISDGDSAARRWIDGLGTWADILSGVTLPDPSGLHSFVRAEVQALDFSEVLDSSAVRAHARPLIQAWISSWSSGLGQNLEINHLKARDLDGYRHVFENHVLAPASYEGIVLDALQGSSLRVGPPTSRDFFIVTAITDIAPQAVLVLSEPT